MIEENDQSQEPSSTLRLGPRDKELLAHIAIAKYLNDSQVHRLVFRTPLRSTRRGPEKANAPVDDSGARKRLRRLATCNPALLRQLTYRDAHGNVRSAYCVTAAGYSQARPLLRRAPPPPPGDGHDAHVAHDLALNELYVALATSRPGLVRADALPFHWIAESIQLPWREFSPRRGEDEERRLVPDAILELQRDKARVFVECEMGGHPVQRHPKSEHDSVFAKLQRYAAFIFPTGQASHYALKFADRWKPELLLLVHSVERADNITRALAAWRTDHPDHPLIARALDLRGALGEYAPRMGLPAPPAPKVELEARQVQMLVAALQQTVTTYKSVRQFLRAHPDVRAKGCPFPEYTPEYEQAVALAEELRKQPPETRR